ncbi:MAG: hypothetical protein GWO41_15025, partial [candidate division Zixibacteria bacterium]|nr:hypothetical protein [candidate division Zixibacteria bacterium]NIT54003.1 hypothetical protein [candidate division Zixibacteria bacterium]NIX59757.1 hypothetical protein [candidate division Zixibacteria bacterium]
MYITVCEDDNGDLIEIFASAPVEWQYEKERMSMFESLNRIISLSLRCGVDPTEITRQLRKGSSGREYPAIAADIIEGSLSSRAEDKDNEHAEATAAPMLAKCPCGQIPKALGIDPHGDSKWFFAVPSCCGEWLIEFRSGYSKPDSEK